MMNDPETSMHQANTAARGPPGIHAPAADTTAAAAAGRHAPRMAEQPRNYTHDKQIQKGGER